MLTAEKWETMDSVALKDLSITGTNDPETVTVTSTKSTARKGYTKHLKCHIF